MRRILVVCLTVSLVVTSGCLGLFGSDVTVVDQTTESAMGMVFVDVTVENTADEPRTATVEASVDPAGGNELFKSETVTLDSGERNTTTFMFSNVVPAGESSTSYSSDVSVKNVRALTDSDASS